MKIHTSFISNSSSASYIITIGMDIRKFIDAIYGEYGYQFFNVKELITKVTADIDRYETGLNKQNEEIKNSKAPMYCYYSQENLTKMKDLLKCLESFKDLDGQYYKSNEEAKFVVDKYNAVQWILSNIYHLYLKEDPFGIELSEWTTMHNSCNDVSELMKAIIIYFDFNEPNIIKKCVVDEDN